jgi:hypothetical protein
MINPTYNPEEQILYVHDTGSISLHELVQASKDFTNRNVFPERLKILEFGDASMIKSSVKDLPGLVASLDSVFSKFNTIRHAVICTDPYLVACVLLIQSEIRNSKYTMNIFSTEMAARKWLMEN